ncbi:MAG: hypothetical protein HWD58_14630 [Bacteroidota bacterium]|nr:MAG: hypothetical protein HWD58_14630 [Bacteroidota bacterium]
MGIAISGYNGCFRLLRLFGRTGSRLGRVHFLGSGFGATFLTSLVIALPETLGSGLAGTDGFAVVLLWGLATGLGAGLAGVLATTFVTGCLEVAFTADLATGLTSFAATLAFGAALATAFATGLDDAFTAGFGAAFGATFLQELL